VLTVRRTVIVVVLAIALAIPATASAQSDPTDAQYQPAAQQISAGGAGGGGAEVGAAEAGGLDERVVSGLPFTGFDLLAMGLAAVAITGTGFALRRLSRLPATD
jgi:hypothetical protein